MMAVRKLDVSRAENDFFGEKEYVGDMLDCERQTAVLRNTLAKNLTTWKRILAVQSDSRK